MKTKDTSKRIAEIVAEMASITEFAEGSISSSSNSYSLKDGTRRRAKPHWKFQSLGPRGKRRLERLEAEYARLVTEQSLDALKKTAGEG